MFNISAIGELLIDFTPYGYSDNNNDLYEKNPGGAPANVLVAAAKLGLTTSFLGMVGKDSFGVFLKNVLETNGVDTTGLKFSDSVGTTLAFVHLDDKGDRSFSFYRNPGADMMFSKNDLDLGIIKSSRVFHFGSISLTNEPVRSATIKALDYAKSNGVIVSYDPNLRPLLWKDLQTAKENIISVLKYADIIKVSEEELEFITGTSELEEGTEILLREGSSLILVTLGERGCFYRYKGSRGHIPSYKVNTIDTTGAGDAFFGGILFRLSEKSLEDINNMDTKSMEDAIRFANAVGALATTKKGAIPAMPILIDVESLIQRQ